MTENIAEPLLKWYDKNKRILPWRDKNNAYYTWVSEIMLQQTRVEAVKPYFARFIQELPDVEALAAAPEERIVNLWEGLGYYSRVRNMQKAAIQVMEEYDGRIPEDFETLLSLKGIGRYTAGAIASIAYGKKVPAVDGNVLRVYARLTENRGDIMKQSVRKAVENELTERMPKDRPGDFNQAMMELGATVCLPNGAPLCDLCPARAFCTARLTGRTGQLPVKAAKKARRVEERTVFLIFHENRVALRRRPGRGLLAGLWQYPNVLGKLSVAQAIAQAEQWGVRPRQLEKCVERQHIFTHITWRMTAYYFQCGAAPAAFIWAAPSEIAQRFALPTAFHMFFEEMK